MTTVKALIAQLKKLPSDAKLCWIDHDQNEEAGEYSGVVHRAEEAPPALKLRGFGVMLS